ncbi:uncharacterized protein LOC143253099 isoform X2 [Tachypleus tridentatus]|uniref:uncharacterized protein LOC143253099 isoform X2 n=1 Tax=Tachypleus tridentatus TaxID=6853 RepID=UPI003FD5BDF8
MSFLGSSKARIFSSVINSKEKESKLYYRGITKLINDKAAFPLHEGECNSSDEKAPRNG